MPDVVINTAKASRMNMRPVFHEYRLFIANLEEAVA